MLMIKGLKMVLNLILTNMVSKFIFLTLIISKLLISIARNGQPRSNYNAQQHLIAFVITITLLYLSDYF